MKGTFVLTPTLLDGGTYPLWTMCLFIDACIPASSTVAAYLRSDRNFPMRSAAPVSPPSWRK
jgi:hypothetical protein